MLHCAWNVVDAALEDALVELNGAEVIGQFFLRADFDVIVLADPIASLCVCLGLIVADAWSELAFL